MTTKTNKTVSLVLGSGGARGLAHIGVIRWLDEHGYDIVSISGCSMGAMVGGIYAAGKLDEFEEWIRAINKSDMISLLDIAWDRSGLVKGDKIINTLKELVGDETIEHLPLRFTAVATDLQNEKEVWINSGKLFDAIRASVSLPLFFTPYRYHGVELIDGGVLNPVPIAPTFSDRTDLTLAVNLGGKVEKKFDQKKEDNQPAEPSTEITEKIKNFIRSIAANTISGNGDSQPSRRDVFDIANQAFDAMQGAISRQKLASYPADFTIEIPRNACGAMEFDCAARMIDLGYQRAEEVFSGA